MTEAGREATVSDRRSFYMDRMLKSHFPEILYQRKQYTVLLNFLLPSQSSLLPLSPKRSFYMDTILKSHFGGSPKLNSDENKKLLENSLKYMHKIMILKDLRKMRLTIVYVLWCPHLCWLDLFSGIRDISFQNTFIFSKTTYYPVQSHINIVY